MDECKLQQDMLDLWHLWKLSSAAPLLWSSPVTLTRSTTIVVQRNSSNAHLLWISLARCLPLRACCRLCSIASSVSSSSVARCRSCPSIASVLLFMPAAMPTSSSVSMSCDDTSGSGFLLAGP